VEPRTTLLEDVPKMVRAFEKKNKLKFWVGWHFFGVLGISEYENLSLP
jgi:hypothetical protein